MAQVFRCEAARALYSIPGMEYWREAGLRSIKKHRNDPHQNHHKPLRSICSIETNDLLFRIPPAFRLQEFISAHNGNDHAQCRVHGHNLDRVCLLRNTGKWN
jgi:hypothetical protein